MSRFGVMRASVAILMLAMVVVTLGGRPAFAQHHDHGAQQGVMAGHDSSVAGVAGDTSGHHATGAPFDSARARRWEREWNAWKSMLFWGATGIFALACLGMAWLSAQERRERQRRKQLKKARQRSKSAASRRATRDQL